MSIKNRFKVDSNGNLTANYATLRDADIQGTITANDGEIGGFTLGNNYLIASLSAKRFSVYEYDDLDVTRILRIATGYITPTSLDYDMYDFNDDGDIDSNDALILMKFLRYGFSGIGTFELNTASFDHALVIKDSNNKTLCDVGILGCKFFTLSTNYGRIPDIEATKTTITPSSVDTPTGKAVTFKACTSIPSITVTPITNSPYTIVKGVSVTGISETGCTIYVTSSTTNDVEVSYHVMG